MYVKMNREKLIRALENIIEVFFLLSLFCLPAGPVLKYSFQGALLFTWLIKLLIKRKIEFTSTSLDYPILIFLIIGFASVVVNWTNLYQAGKGVSNLWEWFFAFYIVVHLVKRENQLKRFIRVWLASAIVVTLYGIYQYITSPSLFVSSFFTLNSYLSQYLILIIPLILSLFLFKKITKPDKSGNYKFPCSRSILGIVLLLTFILLVLTMERGAWLGIIIGLLTMGIILKEKRILIGVPLLFLLIFFAFSPFKARALSIFQSRYHSERLCCIKSCLTMIKEHPLIGVGLGNFRHYYPDYMLPGAKEHFLHAHNVFLQIAVEMGIPGLLVFLWLLFLFFKDAFSNKGKNEYIRILRVGLSAGIIAILVTSLFHDVFHSRQIATLTWYIIGMVVALGSNLDPRGARGEESTGNQKDEKGDNLGGIKGEKKRF